MKKIFTLLSTLFILNITVIAQPGTQSQQLFGGAGDELLFALSSSSTSDGGSIVGGSTTSSNTGTFTGLTNNGGLDGLLTKLDANENITLQKLYGGSGDDEILGIRQTSDGGYIAVGDATSSNSGTLTGITNNGGKDGWVMKLDASGNIVWQKLLGGSADDILYSARQTTDGGYIISGDANSTNSGTLTGVTNNGGLDAWIIKLDASGNTVWQKLLGGSGFDRFIESAQTTDGGYIAVGTATGSDGTLSGVTSYGDLDGWIVKLDATGNTTWQKLYGGGSQDQFQSVEQTTDGGYITALAAANVNSVNGTYTVAGYGQYDGWVVKTDSLGNLQWQRLFGTSGQDFFDACHQTSDGGYILTGQASSGAQNQGSLTGLTFNGGYDGWIVKLDGAGDLQWQELLGGNMDDNLTTIHETSDGGYFAAGYTNSALGTGTLTGLTNNGRNDGWIVKLAPFTTAKKPGSGNGILLTSTGSLATSPYINVGSGFDFGTQPFTYETWLKRDTVETTLNNYGKALFVGDNNGSWGVGIFNDNTLFFTKVGVNEVSSTGMIADTNWHHVAVVYTGSQIQFYIDGIAAGVTSYTDNFNNTSGNYFIGPRQSFGNSNGDGSLAGKIDETRIWENVALTQTEIRDWMCKKVTAAHPAYNNLLAYFRFDEGSGDTTYSTDGRAGVLVNSPAWLTSGASIGDASAYDYTNATKTAKITAATGESFTVTNTGGNPAGLQVYRVDTIPNTTNGASSGNNNKYFGVFQIAGTTPIYSAVYNYTGNPLYNSNYDYLLALYERHNNSDLVWVNSGAVLNTTNKTLTAIGQSTEYILGVTASTLPITILNFIALKENAAVNLSWQSENEINFLKFEVERSSDGLSFVSIGSLNALHGNATNSYSLSDNAPSIGYNFYRLKQINSDRHFTYSKIIKIDFSKQLRISITPNPAKNYITVSTSDVIKELRLISLDGKLVSRWTNVLGTSTLDISNIAAGVYIVKMITGDAEQSRKIIKQ